MESRSRRQPNCAVEATIAVIGGRWKSLILWNLRDDPLRFTQLQALTPGISKRILTRQLRELEDDGIVMKTTYAEAVPHTDYRLSEKGQSLRPIFHALHEWGIANTGYEKHRADDLP